MINTVLLNTQSDEIPRGLVIFILIVFIIAMILFTVLEKSKRKLTIVDYIPHSKICQVSLTVGGEILIETAEANYKTLMFTTNNNGFNDDYNHSGIYTGGTNSQVCEINVETYI
jgi:hypothetical protein